MYARKLIKRIIIILGVLIVLGYSVIALSGFVKGPRITILSPKTGFATTTALVTITGTVVHASDLTINDLPVPLDLSGNFRERLLLAPGYNIMSIKAKDRYGRITEETVETIFNQPPPTINDLVSTSTDNDIHNEITP